MSIYLIAVKRDKRQVASKWIETLAGIEGLKVIGPVGPHRVQVNATEDAIKKAEKVLSDVCHIEKMIPHKPL